MQSAYNVEGMQSAYNVEGSRGNIVETLANAAQGASFRRPSADGSAFCYIYRRSGNIINGRDRCHKAGFEDRLRNWHESGALHRPQTVTYADAVVNYQYDPAGRWTQISDASGAITWEYDNANWLTKETTAAGDVVYGYNNANQRNSMTAPGSTAVTYGYDTADRLQTITQGSETFTYGYDTLSRRNSLARPNGVTTIYEYDEVSRLKRLKHVNASNVSLEDFQYEFNLDDEINKITSLAAAPLVPASKTVAAADAANRISQFGAASYGFDQEGQTITKSDGSGATNYQWDAWGRLTQVTLPSGQMVNYGYDPLGRRARRTANSSTTTFTYDGPDVVVDQGNGGTVSYLNGLSIDDKLRQAGGAFGTFYFLQDHLGTTSALTSTSGGVVEQQQYEIFGTSTNSARTRYVYTGREKDDLVGLIYYRARWYDTHQNRFLSEDPIGFDSGYNLYAYVVNSPVNYADPLGLQQVGYTRPENYAPSPLSKDDAGRQCCKDEMKNVILWNLTNETMPHTFLQTPNKTEGYYMADYLFATFPDPFGSGNSRDNSRYLRTKKLAPIMYKACPESIKALEESMEKNAEGKYSLYNIGAPNYTGWACSRLEDAGFTPPMPSWTPYLNPWFIKK